MLVFLVALVLLLSIVANKQHPAGPPETNSQPDP